MSLEAVAAEAGVTVGTIRIIAKWESCLKKVAPNMFAPYLCPARVATIGIGTTVWPDGRKVRMTDEPISRERCEEVLAYDIGKRYAPAVDRVGLPWQHANQRGACISFAYNVGTAGFSKSTLCWMIKQKKYDRAANEFLKWVNGGGRRLQGLVNRRNDERRMFLTPTSEAIFPGKSNGGPSVIDTPSPASTPVIVAPTSPASPVSPPRAPERNYQRWLRNAWEWLS